MSECTTTESLKSSLSETWEQTIAHIDNDIQKEAMTEDRNRALCRAMSTAAASPADREGIAAALFLAADAFRQRDGVPVRTAGESDCATVG